MRMIVRTGSRWVRTAAACLVSGTLAACGGGGGGGDIASTAAGGDESASAAEKAPAGKPAGKSSSTHLGAGRPKGLIAKRLAALQCGAHIDSRHSDYRTVFGRSTKARLQMPDDCEARALTGPAARRLKRQG